MPKVARAVLPPPRAATTTQDGTTTSNGRIPKAVSPSIQPTGIEALRGSIESHDLPTAYGYGMIWVSRVYPRHVFLQKIGEEHDVMGYHIAGQSHITQGVGLF